MDVNISPKSRLVIAEEKFEDLLMRSCSEFERPELLDLYIEFKNTISEAMLSPFPPPAFLFKAERLAASNSSKITTQDYVPYGDEWKGEMRKLSKDMLIELLKDQLQHHKAATMNISDPSSAQYHIILDTLPLRARQMMAAIIFEFNEACKKHPKWPTSVIDPNSDTPRGVGDFVHAAAIVSEEAGELIRAALNNHYEGEAYQHMRAEAIQTGAMALRFLVNS